MQVSKNKFHNLFIIALIFFFVIFFGKNLNPFDNVSFIGHDETQLARVSEYLVNLKNGIFPPKIAPNMSFGMGYPIFNFYAPMPYLLTSVISFLGFDIPSAIEASFFIALLIGLTGMYSLLRLKVSDLISATSALFFATSTYFATDIFVRYNLAETWFMALVPWGFYAVTNSKNNSNFFIKSLLLSFAFTSHTLLSLFFIPLIFIFTLLQRSIKSLIIFVCAILLSAYFLIPLFANFDSVSATEIATISNYKDHFLCLSQLWYSPVGYGGSASGCTNDGMSFMIGKLLIIAGLTGIFFYILKLRGINFIKSSESASKFFYLLIFLGSIFLTSGSSSFIWNLLSEYMAVFQFPWRFLVFVVFGLSYFSSEFINFMPRLLKKILVLSLIISLFILQPKFFKGVEIQNTSILEKYASKKYIKNEAAFKVAEYLPNSANYEAWRGLEAQKTTEFTLPVVIKNGQAVSILKNEPFEKIFLARGADPLILNSHITPWTEYKINDNLYIPQNFDLLGRPLLDIPSGNFDKISFSFKETIGDKVGNWLTSITVIILLTYQAIFNLWFKKIKISKKIH